MGDAPPQVVTNRFPRAGRSCITGNKGNFRPHHRGRGRRKWNPLLLTT